MKNLINEYLIVKNFEKKISLELVILCFIFIFTTMGLFKYYDLKKLNLSIEKKVEDTKIFNKQIKKYNFDIFDKQSLNKDILTESLILLGIENFKIQSNKNMKIIIINKIPYVNFINWLRELEKVYRINLINLNIKNLSPGVVEIYLTLS